MIVIAVTSDCMEIVFFFDLSVWTSLHFYIGRASVLIKGTGLQQIT